MSTSTVSEVSTSTEIPQLSTPLASLTKCRQKPACLLKVKAAYGKFPVIYMKLDGIAPHCTSTTSEPGEKLAVRSSRYYLPQSPYRRQTAVVAHPSSPHIQNCTQILPAKRAPIGCTQRCLVPIETNLVIRPAVSLDRVLTRVCILGPIHRTGGATDDGGSSCLPYPAGALAFRDEAGRHAHYGSKTDMFQLH